MIELKNIEVKKTARYATYGNLDENTTDVWFVIHGYGQLVEFFMKKFTFLNPETNFVVAPEALSRHYLPEKNNKVGAVWMTKEDRENEVKDYVNYLETLQNTLLSSHTHPYRLHILAFSQGCSTAWRWVNAGNTKADNLILWAGDFAHEIDYSQIPIRFPLMKILYVYGLQDEVLAEWQTFEVLEQKLKAMDFLLSDVITFEGKHELNQEILKEVENIVTKKISIKK